MSIGTMSLQMAGWRLSRWPRDSRSKCRAGSWAVVPSSKSVTAERLRWPHAFGACPDPSDWENTGMQASISLVRPASPQDAAACVAIYRPYVEDTAISWEIEVPTAGEMAARIARLRETHEWLVLEGDDRVVGFAYAHAFNRLAVYQWSVQTGIYVDV